MTPQNRRARLLAFYLPQFYPIPENDAWWGAGFTEWTNVARARPLFRGHYQPRLPADLGFYDLRIGEVREAQADLARGAGIEGFAYYHYWFGGKELLGRPLTEVLRTGRPKFPFCLCWANQTWSGIWHGAPNRILIEQTYPGKDDNEQHFLALLDAFEDERYVRVDGKPVFVIYRPQEVDGLRSFLEQWRDLAAKHGLKDVHFVAHLFSHELPWDYRANGFDAAVAVSHFKAFTLGLRHAAHRPTQQRDRTSRSVRPGLRQLLAYANNRISHGIRRVNGGPRVILYDDAMSSFLDWDIRDRTMYPCVIPGWDNTPRSGYRGVVLHDSTPERFAVHLEEALSLEADDSSEHRLVFVKSWNEWAEGNYLEPDARFGHEYLRVIRQAVTCRS